MGDFVRPSATKRGPALAGHRRCAEESLAESMVVRRSSRLKVPTRMRLKQGSYRREAIAERRQLPALMRQSRMLIQGIVNTTCSRSSGAVRFLPSPSERFPRRASPLAEDMLDTGAHFDRRVRGRLAGWQRTIKRGGTLPIGNVKHQRALSSALCRARTSCWTLSCPPRKSAPMRLQTKMKSLMIPTSVIVSSPIATRIARFSVRSLPLRMSLRPVCGQPTIPRMLTIG